MRSSALMVLLLGPLGVFASDHCPGDCISRSGGNVNLMGYACSFYDNGGSGWCREYDTADFSANTMCCACGGGECQPFCDCDGGTAATASECPVAGTEKCTACDPGYTLVDEACIQNECNCDAGIPARGAACQENGTTVCVDCLAFGSKLVKFDGLQTGTCDVAIQELCNCDHGTGAEGIDCTIQDKLVLGSPALGSWGRDAHLAECTDDKIERNVPHEGAISLTTGICEDDFTRAVWASTMDVPDGAQEVAITFKSPGECKGDCIALAVSLIDTADGSDMTLCMLPSDDISMDFCHFEFVLEDSPEAEHTVFLSFHDFYLEHGKHIEEPQLSLLVVGGDTNRTTQILNMEFVRWNYFKVEDDDYCTSCDERYLLKQHEDGSGKAFCQATCTCAQGTPAEGEDCLVPGEVCASCTTADFKLVNGACQAIVDKVDPAGGIESMPSRAARLAGGVAAGAIGESSLPTMSDSRTASLAGAFVGSFFAVGLFLGARAWRASHQYSSVEPALLTQNVEEDA